MYSKNQEIIDHGYSKATFFGLKDRRQASAVEPGGDLSEVFQVLRFADKDANADGVDLAAPAVVDPDEKAYESLTTGRPSKVAGKIVHVHLRLLNANVP